MRAFVVSVLAAVLAACGQPAGAGGEAAAQAGGGEAAYVEACVARYVAQSAQASRWAPGQCAEEWGRVVASGALAEAILAAAGGAAPRSGRLGADLEVAVDAGARTATWRWAETGAMIPYDAVGALGQRGATVAMIGCSQWGAGEFNKAYRVAPGAGAPFQLTIYERTAPTANAESFYSATAHLNGRVQTRAELARDGMEWTEVCAY